MWIYIVIVWIIVVVDGKTINECRLVLHSLTVAVCQLYLAVIPLRCAMQQFVECVRQIKVHKDIISEKRLKHPFDVRWEDRMFKIAVTNSALHFFEGLCLLWETSAHLLATLSTLFVAVRHVLQGALFLMLSTLRYVQQLVLLDFKEGKEEWEKKQEKQRQGMRKEGEHVEEFITEYSQDAITSHRRRNRKTGQSGHYL